MKFNKNKKSGAEGQKRGPKNDKFFKRDKGDNKFKSYKKDQKGFSGRPDNKQKPGFKKHFKKDEQKKPFNPRRPEDKGGFKQYQNPYVKENNSVFTGNKSQPSFKKPLNEKYDGNKNTNIRKDNRGQWNKNQPQQQKNQHTKPRNTGNGKHQQKKPQNTGNGNHQQKKPHLNDSDDESEDEAPPVNYCIAPNLLEQKLRKKQQFEDKDKKVDKREEYLKQKQRRNEILKQKTRKGQPVMAGRMQLLYEKVAKVVAKENEGR